MRIDIYSILLFISLSFFTFSLPAQIIESERYDEKEVEIETQFLEGSRQLVLGQYEEAIKIYSQLVKKDKENAVIHFQLSRCYEVTKDMDKAISHGKLAVKIDPTNEYYYMQLAESYEAALQLEDAAKTYLSYTKQDPNDPFFYERAVYFFLQNNDEISAISALESMEKNLGIQESTTKQLHEIYATKGDEKNAAKQLEKLTKEYPSIARYKLNLANYYVKIGQTKKAKKIFASFKGEDSSNAVDDYLQNTGSGSKNLAVVKAIRTEIPQKGISIDKKITGLIPVLEILSAQYDEPLAQELLLASSDLLDMYPDDPKAHAFQADIYNTMGDTDAAISAYKETIKLNSSVFDVWFQLMNIQKDQKLYDDLEKTSDQALLRFPNQAIAYLFNAYSLNRKNEPADALDILQEAMLMSSENKQLRKSIKTEMAYSKFLQQEYDAALKILDSEPNETLVSLELYGDIYMKLGEKNKAIQKWKKALSLDPDSQELISKIENKQI